VALPLDRIREIEAVAIAARTQVGLGSTYARSFDVAAVAVQSVPAFVTAVPNLRNGDVRVSGLLERARGMASLSYEMYEPPFRQRFTMSHELGHHFLNEPGPIVCTPDQVDPPDDAPEPYKVEVEAAADAFAAAFLMPVELLAQDLARFGRGVPFLAQLYSVTEPAMRRRLKVLDLLK
jgi:hypothetical protein